ncbi:SDR family oxidoreductase [Neobacillus sp. PS3-34]|uniref:SDR family oxidoreductase n=1 Tax=Neobacillus sp. PS3-34 TaxID=3070678 RepID=UPI0027E14182|nr:SDR family oxidoreductase [Neobacillus sp. PS3-34]WML47874.1 SDR family oxidoreductase [Neobacillus sp. PS3-34]
MNGKTAMITGGASGIGRNTAFSLAEKGFSLALNYRNSEREANSLANELTDKFGTTNLVFKGDVANKDDCERMVCEVLGSFSRIDVLIHNAGPYIYERKKMADYSFKEWNYIINGNLSAVFYLTKLLLPGMRNNKWGRIITMGYDRAENAPGWIYRSAFAAAKTGLASLTRTIALEEAENGITANMVCPGDIVKEWKEKGIKEAKESNVENSPVGRPGTGEDVSRVITFLTEKESDFITGSVIPVTGGSDVLGKIFRIDDSF